MSILIAVAAELTQKSRTNNNSRLSVGVPVRYVASVANAGARAVLLPPSGIDELEAAAILERFDGLLLVGGGDVSPSLYGEDALPEVTGVDGERDEGELALARAALWLGLPTLAICRGMQVLNVARGGTLSQHIDGGPVDHGSPLQEKWVAHDVEVKAGSALSEILGTTRLSCPSHHHQAVSNLGDGLIATAWAPDNVIEGIETLDARAIGVQWHPEQTSAKDDHQHRLFEGFVRHAMSRSARN